MSDEGAPAAAAQPPSDSQNVRISDAPHEAGGLPAIFESLKQIRRQTGLLRGARALLAINQPTGFDCPGCAWPEPRDHRSVAEFCENGAKAVAWEATERRIGAAFFAAHSVVELSRQSDYWLGQQGRIVTPLHRPAGSDHYQPIAWDAAFARIATALQSLHSPDEAAFYTSGRTSNEAAFLYQLFVRMLGTNNLPDCSNLCHESSGVALRETIGIGKGTVQLEDFALCDAIFVIGQNPGTNHPRMLTTLQEAARRGCAIVSVNPLPEAALTSFRHPQDPLDLIGRSPPIASLHLPVRIGGDAAFLKGLMKELFDEETRRPGQVLDRAFIAEHTAGFDRFAKALAEVPWSELTAESGLDRAQIRAAAEVALKSERIICCWAMGLTQHKEAVATIQEIVNFLLLRGNIGRPGTGACPVRGHSNVQGDRTVGITERPSAAFLNQLGRRFNFTPPPHHGLDTVGTIAAMDEGRVKVFVALGGNFLSASPDTEVTARALSRCQMVAHVSTKLHRGHLIGGQESLILPCLGRTERDLQNGRAQLVSVENSMGIVSASRGNLPPADPLLKSEVAIVCGLAKATLPSSVGIDWDALTADYDAIRDHIEAVIPGFDHYNDRVKNSPGFALPNGPRERRFDTPVGDGKAQFTTHPLPRFELLPGQLVMMTLRSHDQFNTTIYGNDDRYRGIAGGRHVIFMNQADLAARELSSGQRVDITSHFRGETRCARDFVVVPYAIPRGCAATYFPEANVLIPLDSYADKSRTPTSKWVAITVEKTTEKSIEKSTEKTPHNPTS